MKAGTSGTSRILLSVLAGGTFLAGVLFLIWSSRATYDKTPPAAHSIPQEPDKPDKPDDLMTLYGAAFRAGSQPPANADALRAELAQIEERFKTLYPDKLREYRAWLVPGGQVDTWWNYVRTLSGWSMKPEYTKIRDAYNWWKQDQKSGEVAAALGRQRTVVASLSKILAAPETASDARAWLEDYSQEPESEDELSLWNTRASSLPPRSLVQEILRGEDVSAELPPDNHIPDDVLEYMRTWFDYSFHEKMVLTWLQDSKPQRLRDMQAEWESLNVRRFEILESLGFDTNKVSRY